jgi:hypothetical protein
MVWATFWSTFSNASGHPAGDRDLALRPDLTTNFLPKIANKIKRNFFYSKFCQSIANLVTLFEGSH